MVLCLLAHVKPSNFFSRKLRNEALVYHHIFFRTAVLRKFLTRLSTRQDGVENRDKVYSPTISPNNQNLKNLRTRPDEV